MVGGIASNARCLAIGFIKCITSKLKLRIKKLQLIREMFLEFKKNEFGGVVKKFGYNHTRNALIMMFKKYIPEYVPQECNRWKNRNK